jgi:hypothetical protein
MTSLSGALTRADDTIVNNLRNVLLRCIETRKRCHAKFYNFAHISVMTSQDGAIVVCIRETGDTWSYKNGHVITNCATTLYQLLCTFFGVTVKTIAVTCATDAVDKAIAPAFPGLHPNVIAVYDHSHELRVHVATSNNKHFRTCEIVFAYDTTTKKLSTQSGIMYGAYVCAKNSSSAALSKETVEYVRTALQTLKNKNIPFTESHDIML